MTAQGAASEVEPGARGAAAEDSRAARAAPSLKRFLPLVAQLGLLLLVFRAFHIEETPFLLMSAVAFGGFLVHYWTPFRYKEAVSIALSLGVALLLLDVLVVILLVGAGLAFFAVMQTPVSLRSRIVLVLSVFAGLAYARGGGAVNLPPQFWSVFGSLFMYRLFIYLYDVAHMPGPPRFQDYLSYFFILPNYYFLLFPVIDFQTMRRSYYQRDAHKIAQQGIDWMVRGTIHLLLYRLVYQNKPMGTPDNIASFGSLVVFMVMTYLLYLRVSGHFHIAIGMLHLFGYDLPETNRRYLLARSLTDFWRRINVYWKDFMVKMVYFPVYFRLRRSGQVRAQLVATAVVFLATWLLHSWQFYWLRGEVLFTWPDAIFWLVLGVLVVVNLLLEIRGGSRPRGISRAAWLREWGQVMATFTLIVTLWSLWQSPSIAEWLDLLTWWKIGS